MDGHEGASRRVEAGARRRHASQHPGADGIAANCCGHVNLAKRAEPGPAHVQVAKFERCRGEVR